MLTDASLYGVVFSEMGRFSRRCSRKEEFMQASVRMMDKMVEVGYNVRKVEAKVKKFVRRVPHLYGMPAKWQIEKPLKIALRRAEMKCRQKRAREERLAVNRVLQETTG